MKFWHPETQQSFRSKAEAQRVLPVIGAALVEPTIADQPTITASQRLVRNTTPTEVDGAWVWGWTVEDMTDEEVRARMVPLSRAQFAIALAAAGVITETEAEDWAAAGVLPSFALTAINSHPTMTDGEKMAARIKARSAIEVDRGSPVVALLQAAKGLTDDQVDALFVVGAAN